MAKVIKDFVPYKNRGPEPRYPWDQWFDGQQWLLTQGEDYESSEKVMQDMIRKKGKKRRLKVSVWYGDEPNTLVVQSFGKMSAKEIKAEEEKEKAKAAKTKTKKPKRPSKAKA